MTEIDFKEVEVVWVNKLNEIYHFDKKIGSGQYGKVWTATDQITGRIVVCKIVERKSDYVRELDHLITLRNSYGILPIKKAVFTNTQMCMEFDLGNSTLTTFTKNRTITDLKSFLLETIKITYQLLCSLAEMHGLNIIHRDLKSGNVVMLNDRAWVIDLGMSKRCLMPDSQDISFYEIVTCTYRAPELWRNQSKNSDSEDDSVDENIETLTYDSKIDIWSVGCILYELIAKDSPFTGQKESDVRRRLAGHLQYYKCSVSNSIYDKTPFPDVNVEKEILDIIHKDSYQLLCSEMEEMMISPRNQKPQVVYDQDCKKIIKTITKLLNATLHPDPSCRLNAEQCIKIINKNYKPRSLSFHKSPLKIEYKLQESDDNWMQPLLTLYLGSDFYKINPRIVYLTIYNYIRVIGTSHEICRDFSLIFILLGCMRLSASYCGEIDIQTVKCIRRHVTRKMDKSPKREVSCASSILSLLKGKIWINNPGEYRQKLNCRPTVWSSKVDQTLFSLIISDLKKEFTPPNVNDLLKRATLYPKTM